MDSKLLAVKAIADFIEITDVGLADDVNVKEFIKSTRLLNRYEEGDSSIIVFWDIKNRCTPQATDGIELIEPCIDEFDESLFPPPHHAWIYCCSNIQIHSYDTARHLAWISKAQQPGIILLHGAVGDKQIYSAKKALSRIFSDIPFIGKIDCDSVDIAKQIKFILSSDDPTPAPVLYALGAYTLVREQMESLARRLEAMQDTASKVTETLKANKRDIVKRSDEIKGWGDITSIRLREELPDFEWLDAILTGCPDVLEVVRDRLHKESSPNISNDDKSNRESDRIERDNKPPDKQRSHRDTVGKKVKKYNKTDAKNLEPDHTSVNPENLQRPLHNEISRAILAQFEFLKPPDLSERGARIFEGDKTLNIAIDRILAISNEKRDSYLLNFATQPKWRVDRELLEKYISEALDDHPIPGPVIQQIFKFLLALNKVKIGVVAMFGQMAIKGLLDRWGMAVYLRVLERWTGDASSYSTLWVVWSKECVDMIDQLIKKISDADLAVEKICTQVSYLNRECRRRSEC